MNNRLLKIVILFIMIAMVCDNLYAQKSDKEFSKSLRSRVEKECRKTAKTLEKEGWEAMPGNLSIERQVQNSRLFELDTDDKGEGLHFISTHTAIGRNYSAAKRIATTRAVADIAGQIESKVASVIENNISNIDFGDGDLESVNNFMLVSKQAVAAQLRDLSSVLDIFRVNDNGTYEVHVVYQLSVEDALNQAKEIYRKDLQKESADLSKKLDKLLLLPE